MRIIMNKHLFAVLVGLVLLGSCTTPRDIAYFQDVQENQPIQTQNDGYIRFQKGDKLNIYVHSRDEQLQDLFNIVSRANSGNNNNQHNAAYTVDDSGKIDFPVLGPIEIEGLTREEVAKYIKDQLISKSLVKDPVVTVVFYNMHFSVLGNAGAGVKEITKDRITLMEALAMASDLQIDGLRKNVLVLRQEGDKQVPYRVDLTSAKSIYNSPAYYIRQHDVIYVEPNNKYKRNSTVMGSSAFQPAFWMSLISFITTMAFIFIKK